MAEFAGSCEFVEPGGFLAGSVARRCCARNSCASNSTARSTWALREAWDSEGVVIVLALANRDTHQDGSGHDHCRRDDNIDADAKPTMALLWLQ